MSPERNRKADFTASWISGATSTLMPYPKNTLNLASLLKPLSYMVITY